MTPIRRCGCPFLNFILNVCLKMYLVTGGYNDGPLSSTETLLDESGGWREVGHLPSAMGALRGVSLNNNILMTGKVVIVTD